MKSLRFTDKDFARLAAVLSAAKEGQELYQTVVNGPFKHKAKVVPLGLGVVVLLLVNEKDKMLDRIALSDTEQAEGAVEYSVKKFHEIRIPLTASKNILIKSLKSGRPHSTEDWQYLFTPALTAQEARFNQAGAGISHSWVYPLEAGNGALIFSYFIPLSDSGPLQQDFMNRYTSLVSNRLDGRI
jgi:hypothetical protein